MDDRDLAAVRELLYLPFALGSHRELDERFAVLGVADGDIEGTKRERVASVVAAIPEGELVRVAQLVVDSEMVPPADRIRIQNLLWFGAGPRIVERSRRELAAVLDIEDVVGTDADRFVGMLERWWDLDRPYVKREIFGDTVRTRVIRHVIRNPGDWSVVDLFSVVGAFDAVDRRFAGFLENLVAPRVVLDEPKQRRLVAAINEQLQGDRLELRESGSEGGYPVFRLMPAGTPVAAPKTLVFASRRKPDMRVSSVIDNDIEILDNGADALVFDRPIDASGLSWRALQQWWRDRHHGLDDDTAKQQLYARLKRYLPQSSPPQQLLFGLYHEIHGPRVPELPALLPEVWLHWDPKTVRERGAAALLGQRMDFLLLLPGPHRVVLEVDGRTHYTDDHGRPSPQVYARNTRLDRQLRMRGYEVFRFGAAELDPDHPEAAKAMLTEFFTALFDRHVVD
ncbi:very-short-patch-repair endonuclease [Nocardia transvalensis]|uniref:Very-short-patch-repair endonuclease n=1 Tax=Nocardia transvalensis TaxID=37333 RepID=A0A7W9UI89_9NOCA|nr:hypothetical protein [Nocardia transvalensis]MBB5913922.1 very-short-patch-repair endonuclease [Nocardia transvalensis]